MGWMDDKCRFVTGAAAVVLSVACNSELVRIGFYGTGERSIIVVEPELGYRVIEGPIPFKASGQPPGQPLQIQERPDVGIVIRHRK